MLPRTPAHPNPSDQLIRLHLNEHPLPPLPSVAQAISEAMTSAHQYPELHPESLTATLAHWCGVPDDHVVVGNGSVGVALQFLHAAKRPGGQLIYAWRNFDAYPLLAHMTDTEPVPVPLKSCGQQDLAAILNSISTQTTAIIICNPHNPTGTLIDDASLAWFLTKVPPRVLILLDQAYIEFAGAHGSTSLDLLRQHPNLVVLRTFSKAYGLAGLRVGYALANPDLAKAARIHQLPFGITSAASAGVHASLRAQTELESRITAITKTRDHLYRTLVQLNWIIPRSHANFLWLDIPVNADTAHKHLQEAHVHTRLYPGEGVRLTVPHSSIAGDILDALGQITP